MSTGIPIRLRDALIQQVAEDVVIGCAKLDPLSSQF
jgi:hypothetical protein